MKMMMPNADEYIIIIQSNTIQWYWMVDTTGQSVTTMHHADRSNLDTGDYSFRFDLIQLTRR